MKKVFLMLLVALSFGFIAMMSWTTPAHGISLFKKFLQCRFNLKACKADLEACEGDCQIFPGDGYPNPDDLDVSGHGPALSYADNGDGTFTDNNTGYMWEIKDDSAGVHDVDNTYTWSSTVPDPDGTLFTVFLDTLNNKCDGGETTACMSDADCVGIGNGLCGHAGYRDWCIPNVKKLQSIVDYGVSNPSSSVPGSTGAAIHWSATTDTFNSDAVWVVSFFFGIVDSNDKDSGQPVARAVRPCS
jgi:hypothetical protein